jgi:hypothetical protein
MLSKKREMKGKKEIFGLFKRKREKKPKKKKKKKIK